MMGILDEAFFESSFKAFESPSRRLEHALGKDVKWSLRSDGDPPLDKPVPRLDFRGSDVDQNPIRRLVEGIGTFFGRKKASQRAVVIASPFQIPAAMGAPVQLRGPACLVVWISPTVGGFAPADLIPMMGA